MKFLILALGLQVPFLAASAKEEFPQMTHVSSKVKAHVFRLKPGQDLVSELSAWAKRHHIKAASILSGVGSLKKVTLRYANQPKAETKEGHFEIVSLTGMLSEDSLHLHASVALPDGSTLGGHLMGENLIYTTAEIAIAEFEDAVFSREKDDTYGYSELVVKKKP
jgi:predicted DNA-binding protein with PD1-like motif